MQIPYDWIPWFLLIIFIIFFITCVLKEYFKSDKRYVYGIALLFMNTAFSFYIAYELAVGDVTYHIGSSVISIYNYMSIIFGLMGFINLVYMLVAIVELAKEYLEYIRI